MLRTKVLSSLFFNGSRRRKGTVSRSKFASRVERLEDRRLLATLTVDVGDPAANDPGDLLFAQIHEAVAAANEGDKIYVKAGIYEPFVADKDRLVIRAASNSASPVVDATGFENGIEVPASDVAIKGFTVINAEQNGFLVTGDSNVFRDNAALDNGLHGLLFIDSDDNRLSGNLAERNGANGFFFLLDSDNNTLIGNSATGNGSAGFRVRAGNSPDTLEAVSDGTTLIRNTASGNTTGFAIAGGFSIPDPSSPFERAFFPALQTRLTDNVSEGNWSSGFDIQIVSGASFIGNLAEGNLASGFSVLDTSDSLLFANSAIDNGQIRPGDGSAIGDGFSIRESNNNRLTANVATGSFDVGIRMRGSSDNRLVGNRAESNQGDGIRLEVLAIAGLVPSGTFPPARGVLSIFSPSVNNTLIGNVGKDNGGSGFRLMGSSGNDLFFNLATGNAEDGFKLEGLEVFALTSPFLVNSGELLDSFDSENNTVVGNLALGNGGFGFSQSAIDEVLTNRFVFNRASGNAEGNFDI